MSEREDFLWQRFFAACALFFVIFTFVGLEVSWPQPPSFAWSAEQTAAYYVEHQTGFLVGVVLCSIGMAFLLIWTVQFCLMLSRLEGGSRAVTAVTVASLAASPVLLSFDLAVFGVVAYRPDRISPDITRALSDLAWLGSQHIWPMLTVGMALAGILILRTQGRPESFPAWLGYFSLVVALCEFGQLPIFFFKSGPLSGDGAAAWYLATFTWGPWILAAGWSMYQILGRLQTNRSAESRHSVLQ
ncbi:hypothetical protein Y900_004780 [Mycolicibacterium aromaticivorans JS19b1 = JCM 16368]|uniref:DUF4386 domain-containing protein n=1 Tax=Mycolicibacterium aromaticivorans JS19b1 = JCM 16368 TaxID=1440774 RepID=A0A064CHR2_9MYCO|nr:hypothetical protein [Mycolicibacterium aromaticivorans]KDE98273.1 hypothetical protein Y900_004780 [Mycolicibacterium aromaticivorans JS19b1 = JCM 16368]